MSDVPLGEHALLSDCGAAALVTAAGSVDWLCLPRFDSRPVLGRLLDERAGHFLLAPATEGFVAAWRYRSPGLLLESTWSALAGELLVIDAMAMGPHERGHDLGRSAPGVLLRQARCTRGSVQLRVEYAPRPEFGLIHPRLAPADGAIVSQGGATVLILSTEIPLDLADATASATVTLTESQELGFAVAQCDPWGPTPPPWSKRQIRRRLKATETAWQSWSALHQRYEGPLKELVHHSGVVLQGLTYARSGAMVAAPTTSLPEGIGSGRTWDYRFTWVRDASMTLQGLFIAACPDEAGRFFSFLARAAGTQLDRGLDLQIIFGVGGERDLTEHTIARLSGWRDSGPVRTGNQAWGQRQLDVYGALLDAAYTLRDQLKEMELGTQVFLVAAVEAAAARWRQDDQGIWEVRGQPRPYLHSKLMCWVALDRGIAMADHLDAGEHVTRWAVQRDELREAILRDGWNEPVGAYTQYFGSATLDAAVLLMGIVGFLAPDDPRLLATIDAIEAIEAGLRDDRGLLYRYRGGDGIAGGEGSFLLCTFWLAHALVLTGQLARSRDVLERAAGFASPLGLVTAAQALADAQHTQLTSPATTSSRPWATPNDRSHS